MRVVLCLCFLLSSSLAFADPTKDLFDAIHASEENKIKIALRDGADPNAQNDEGQRPLHVAVNLPDLRFFVTLVDAGANPNLQNGDGQAPIHIAAALGHRNELEELIRLGAHFEAQNAQGLTARQLAVNHNHPEIEALFTDAQAMLDLMIERDRRMQEIEERRRKAEERAAQLALEADLQRANDLQAAEQEAELAHWNQQRADARLARVVAVQEGARRNQGGWLSPFTLIPAAALVMFGLAMAQNQNGGSQ